MQDLHLLKGTLSSPVVTGTLGEHGSVLLRLLIEFTTLEGGRGCECQVNQLSTFPARYFQKRSAGAQLPLAEMTGLLEMTQ